MTRDGTPRQSVRLCLKARPTAAQLADRLRPVDGSPADGLELYLDAADLVDQAAMDEVVRAVHGCDLPSEFALLAEGPVGSLDGGFFDVAGEREADRLVVERLASLARRLGLRAVNIHLIAPHEDPSCLTLALRAELLRRAVPFLREFVEAMRAASATPTIENMPPVLRMRQGGFFFTPIGLASEDLLWMAEQVPGLEILPDTSHAGLYLNARAIAAADAPAPIPAAPATADPAREAPAEESGARAAVASPGGGPLWLEAEARTSSWLAPLLAYVRQLPAEPASLLGYLQALAPRIANAQVSNAAGLLGEGLPYAEGAFDLDPAIRWLGATAAHIVTETLEPEPDNARWMRDALRRMRKVVA